MAIKWEFRAIFFLCRPPNGTINRSILRKTMKPILGWRPLLAFWLGFSGSLALAAPDQEKSLACKPDFEPADGSYQFVEEETPSYEVPDDAVIDEIHYTRLPIFDESNPREDNALYRWANSFHVLTKEPVISQQVLFEEGQSYDQRLLEETARLLRQRNYLYDVDVRAVSQCGDKVDVEVITKDVWSFVPEIDFDRSGGDNTYGIGLTDTNIFGSGKHLSISYDNDTDRTSYKLEYKDDNVFGSRVETQIAYTDSDDGSNQSFGLALPFYSLDTRRSWAIRLEKEERDDPQFFRGDDVTEVEHEIEDYFFRYGFSSGLRDGVVHRWNFGYHYREDKFGPSEDLPPPAEFPIDKTMSYPFVSFETLEDKYDTAFNLDQIHKTEDLHLGLRLFGRIGYASEGLGSDQDRIVVQGAFSDTLQYNDNVLWRHELEWEGMWNQDTDRAEDVIVSYQTRYFRRQTSHRSFFATLNVVYSKNLNTHQQVVLGGLTGTRGFENRFQVGDRRAVLNLEERMYTDIHLFNLIRVGWALFIDVGRAWEPDVDSGMEDDYLANVGFGLRLASSKAEAGRIAHIDVAFPLTNKDDEDVDSPLIAVNIKRNF